MKLKSASTTAAVFAIGALALPAGAAAHKQTGVKSVKAHVDRADSMLEKALARAEKRSDRRAAAGVTGSRREMAMAVAEAAKLRRNADSEAERGEAGRAQALVAAQQDENVDDLVAALEGADGRVENAIAKAALGDTRGRDKAIAVITALLEQGVSSKTATGLATALSALAQNRDDEVREEAEALVDDEVSAGSKRHVAQAVRESVQGQRVAGGKLAELIASDTMPEQSKDGLRRAYEAVTAEQGSVEAILARLSDRMPASVRSFVEQIIRQARENAQGMRESRPAPPTGGGQPGDQPGRPEGTPSGAPQGTPTGAPEGTPTGQPEGIPTGAPDGTPTGAPEGGLPIRP